MGMFDYQDEIHPLPYCEEREEEQEWMREAYNWQSLSGSEKYFDMEAEDGFHYALTREQQKCLWERLYHVSACLDEAWEKCADIFDHVKDPSKHPDLERGWPYTKREEYVQDIYRYFRWTRNNLADIKIERYFNDGWTTEYCSKCIDICKEIKEQIKTLLGLIPAVEATGTDFDLTKALFRLWNEADEILIRLESIYDDKFKMDDAA